MAEQQNPQESALPPILLPALRCAAGCQVGGRHALGAMDRILVSRQRQVSAAPPALAFAVRAQSPHQLSAAGWAVPSAPCWWIKSDAHVLSSRALAHVHVLLSIHQPRRFNGEAYVSIQSSSIPQQPNEFTKIFKNYTASAAAGQAIPARIVWR